MKNKAIGCILVLLIAVQWSFSQGSTDIPVKKETARISIAYDTSSRQIAFAVGKLEEACQKAGHQLVSVSRNADGNHEDIIVTLTTGDKSIQKEGYKIVFEAGKLTITAIDANGAMYGVLDVAEQVRNGKQWHGVKTGISNPRLAVRAIKFNLPWSSYRSGQSMELHMETCRDLNFWQAFLDQMAENRFNLLSLWNIHPFSFMVKPGNYPLANHFSEAEMKEWKHFFTSLFRMARERGIEPFIVNWNIAVSPEFAKAYGVKERNDTSVIVKKYTREVVTQVINEYPDLAGIGITLADWMSNFKSANNDLPEMNAKDRENWIAETVIAGIKAADRPVKLIHRSVLSGDPLEMRRVIDAANLPDTTLVEVKFNWSHGHSTPVLAMTHDSHSGKKDDGYWNPMPSNYRIEWMIRNEDFFILRWGHPDFVRQHIAQNTQPYVNGYFVGSEGYIPAKDFSHKDNSHRNWKYAFEKQWLFYMLWGRLLYDPSTANKVFEQEFNARYDDSKGSDLLRAYTYASGMPLKLASFFASTWDYSLYSEGFLAPFSANAGLHDTVSSFISIDEMIDHPTLDPSYVSISDYVSALIGKRSLPPGRVSPLVLADSLEKDGKKVIKLLESLRKKSSPALTCELDDLETWAYLSLYFSDKLRAGVALKYYRLTGNTTQKKKSVDRLVNCLLYWKKIDAITAAHYKEIPYIDGYQSLSGASKDALYFSWSKFLPQIERDITIAKNAERIISK